MIHRRVSGALVALLVSTWALPAAAVRMVVPEEHADPGAALTDRLIVKYREGHEAGLSARSRAAAWVAGNRQGVRLDELRPMAGGAHVMQISRALAHRDMQRLADSLRQGDTDIEFAEPDRLHRPLFVPDDAMLSQQWGLSDTTAGIRAPQAWDRSRGAGIVVAVIDTGVRPHADLAANLLPGRDFVTDLKMANDGNARDADAADPGDHVTAGFCGVGSASERSSWHGTHVAGLVAAVGNNRQGVAGVAFGARVLPLRVLGRCGGYTSDIADAIVWAAGGTVPGQPANPNPARVLNLSLGGPGACDRSTQAAVDAARARGAVVVVSAGNENTDAASSSPANCQGVVTVAATNRAGGRASYSNTGAVVALAAPGGDTNGGMLSTLNAGTAGPAADSYAQYMGTSMAAPMVSGVAALMLSINRALSPDQVAAMLKASARPFPAACAGCGSGIVDAQAAVALAAGAPAPVPTPSPPTPTPPTPTPPTPPTPTPVVTALKDLEPNDTFARAQAVPVLPAKLTGALGKLGDVDHFKLSVPAGRTLKATLVAGPTSGFGLTVLDAKGKSLLVVPGGLQRQIEISVTNNGASAMTLVYKVLRSTGAAGGYQLAWSH